MLTAKTCPLRTSCWVRVRWRSATNTVGGSSAMELKLLAVMPWKASPDRPVTMATPVSQARMASFKSSGLII